MQTLDANFLKNKSISHLQYYNMCFIVHRNTSILTSSVTLSLFYRQPFYKQLGLRRLKYKQLLGLKQTAAFPKQF